MLQKHLSLQDRQMIERFLNEKMSFKGIARRLQKDPTTISKEIRKHLQERTSGAPNGWPFNPCVYRLSCTAHDLCKRCYKNSRKNCRFCAACNRNCADFLEDRCVLVEKPPYVCNGCDNRWKCTLRKQVYSAGFADRQYRETLSETRKGIAADEAELERLDGIISPLVKQGLSIHHICAHNADIIMHDEKTIYNYISYGLLTVKNLDLPRLVRYRKRRKLKPYKVDKQCRIGRTYEDFKLFMQEHPDTQVVQMDSVEGTKGGKVLLTIHFVETQFMLAFLRDANTSRSVTATFDFLHEQLDLEVFRELFPVIITDNGSEFSDPYSIEFDSDGNRRTYVFYCDSSSPYQKGAIENNHTLLRRVLPKGTSFDDLKQADIDLMMDHINSYGRKKLNDRSPHQSFSFFHGDDIVGKLNSHCIQPNKVILCPRLLKK